MKISYTIKTAITLGIKAKFFSFLAWTISCISLTSLLAAQFGGRQPSTMALDTGISVIRLALPLFVILLAQELFTKEFERKFYLISLTYPKQRHTFYLGRLFAIILLSLATLGIGGLVLLTISSVVDSQFAQHTPISLGFEYWLTLSLIAIDTIVIASIAALIATCASTPSFVLLGTLGFTLISRSYSTVISLLQTESELVFHSESYQYALRLINFLTPDLGSLDTRSATLYANLQLLPQHLELTAIHAITYASAATAIGVWVLNRKQLA